MGKSRDFEIQSTSSNDYLIQNDMRPSNSHNVGWIY